MVKLFDFFLILINIKTKSKFSHKMDNKDSTIKMSEQWEKLEKHSCSPIPKLKSLLSDMDRSEAMWVEYDGIMLDYSHQKVTYETMNLLYGSLLKLHLSYITIFVLYFLFTYICLYYILI